ncbi:N-acetylmuramoyl-L-alanine amidase family protein [Pleomorphovibrio marinus]|uniref:N-acetylmuramoyl-L-alanine amidase family protein n=1 Tax=Pleomorphovibrio marinus TaxID=2164132 RepID=UPI000E0C87BE|nr:N-acetylmuramoyl-L-alanine amidase [Pleomorphovibrio marinus]
MIKYLIYNCIAISILVLASVWGTAGESTANLKNKTVCLDPGHGGTSDTDQYRVGPTGEREEWVNLRVALHLKEKLENAGAKVIMTRDSDEFIPLDRRSEIAKDSNADIFLSIHHNATADTAVNFPIVYFHGSATENLAGVKLAQLAAQRFREHLFGNAVPVSVVSDFTIFPSSGASVLRGTYGIPGIVAEASFFSNPSEEQRLKVKEYNELEAEAYFLAIRDFFELTPQLVIHDKVEPNELPIFEVLQEAERMRPEAKLWKEHVEQAKKLFESGDLDKAFELFTQSAKSFPDSYVAGEAMRYRVKILELKDKTNQADKERRRLHAFYPEE